MNYFRKRRRDKRNLIVEFTVPQLIVPKFNMKLKKKADHAVQYDNGGLVRSYYCRTCACWHTTSKSNKPPLSLKTMV